MIGKKQSEKSFQINMYQRVYLKDKNKAIQELNKSIQLI